MDANIFNKAAQGLDAKIHEVIKRNGWSFLLPKSPETLPHFKYLQEHIAYLILNFLNGDMRELFIQIPVEDFVNRKNNGNDSLQKETFVNIGGVIMGCLNLATIESAYDSIKVPDKVAYKNSTFGNISWYNIGDVFFESNEEVYIECTKENHVRIYRAKDSGSLISKTDEKEELISQSSAIYRIKEIPGQWQNGAEQLKETIKQLHVLRGISNGVKQYKNATFVTYNTYTPENKNIPSNSRFIFSPVDVISTKDNIEDLKTEIIVVYGDKFYQNRIDDYRAAAYAKKIIYIGSYYDKKIYQNIPNYPFSFREIYRYCAPTNVKYDEMKFKIFEFPWLNDTLVNLNLLLDSLAESDDTLTSDYQQKIKRYLLSFFTDASFSKERLTEFKKFFNSNILDEKELISNDSLDETVERLLNWINKLEYDSLSNPKMEYIKRVEPILTIYKYDNYVRRVKALVGYDNKIVIDSPSYSKLGISARDKVYKFIMRHCLFAQITGLYYSVEKKFADRLQKYIADESNVYCNEIRKQYGTNLELELKIENPIEEDGLRIEDFMEDLSSDFNDWKPTSKQKTVTIVFNDETMAIVDGEVLLDNEGDLERVSIEDVKKFVGQKIYYYQKPENFDNLIKAYVNLPENADVDFYSCLWKNALLKYISNQMVKGEKKKDIIKYIFERTKIKESIIKPYTKENCNSKFMKRRMNAMCDFLKSEQLLSESESKYICAAQRMVMKENTSFGRMIKNEALSYILDNNTDGIPVLKKLSEKIEMEIEQLVYSFIKVGYVKQKK